MRVCAQSAANVATSAADLSIMAGITDHIISGDPFTERKSTFQAHLCPVTSIDQVKAVVAVLLQNNKIRNATHNIMAYRTPVPDKPGVYWQVVLPMH